MIEPSVHLSSVGGLGAKLQDHPLRRQAIVAVRQSHPPQVLEPGAAMARHYA